jgi:hypothetical protein
MGRGDPVPRELDDDDKPPHREQTADTVFAADRHELRYAMEIK